jgi:hypothetical protein
MNVEYKCDIINKTLNTVPFYLQMFTLLKSANVVGLDNLWLVNGNLHVSTLWMLKKVKNIQPIWNFDACVTIYQI